MSKQPRPEIWFVQTSDNGGGLVIKPIPGQVICQMDETPDMAANAQLIAAAPELLAALKAADDYFKFMINIVENSCEEHRGEIVQTRTVKGKNLDELFEIYQAKAEAAINKATGKL